MLQSLRRASAISTIPHFPQITKLTTRFVVPIPSLVLDRVAPCPLVRQSTILSRCVRYRLYVRGGVVHRMSIRQLDSLTLDGFASINVLDLVQLVTSSTRLISHR